MTRENARRAVMAASQEAMKEFRANNPIPRDGLEKYLEKQRAYINDYVFRAVPENVRKAAV